MHYNSQKEALPPDGTLLSVPIHCGNWKTMNTLYSIIVICCRTPHQSSNVHLQMKLYAFMDLMIFCGIYPAGPYAPFAIFAPSDLFISTTYGSIGLSVTGFISISFPHFGTPVLGSTVISQFFPLANAHCCSIDSRFAHIFAKSSLWYFSTMLA